MEHSLQSVIGRLELLFDTFNNKFFGGLLEHPVIAVSPDTTGGAFGWFTTWRAWKKENSDGYFEINVTAEHLNRPFTEVCATLLHEMVHLENHLNEIKDCSRGNTYHNKKFKETAEARGLIIEKTEKYGWTKTSLQDSTKEFIDSLGFNSFPIHREKAVIAEKTGKKSSSKKYVCPICGTIIRATKEVSVRCDDCDVMFELEGAGENAED